VSQLNSLLLTEKDVSAPGEYRKSVQLASGTDLVVTADWDDDHPHALQAEIQLEGRPLPQKNTFWSGRILEDTISLPFLP
jgi:hypothetical protein